MKNSLQIGDAREHTFQVKKSAFPEFYSGVVHEVCSTYFLAKKIEWTTRLFVLDIIENDEEGIGTMIAIDHISPALYNQTVKIVATVDSFERNELKCSFEASVDGRIVAKGRTGQKILKKEKLKTILSSLGS